MNLRTLLESALADAVKAKLVAATPQLLHRARSQAWIAALARHLRLQYSGNSFRVLSRYDTTHRAEFGLNELLYDVLVCRVGNVPSARHRKSLTYIKEVIWQVESEFARDSGQALRDFNKLVLGTGHNKLFVGPIVHDNQPFVDVLLRAAAACTGDVHVALIPHPGEWDAFGQKIYIAKYKNGKWVSIA